MTTFGKSEKQKENCFSYAPQSSSITVCGTEQGQALRGLGICTAVQFGFRCAIRHAASAHGHVCGAPAAGMRRQICSLLI